MARKFDLKAKPTFKCMVGIPIPGARAPIDVEFTFKAKTRDEFKEFVDSLRGREDVDVVMEIASGWDLEDAFNAENVAELIQNYIGSARAIMDKYIAELTAARVGN